ncbi:hypothetical protein CTAYLR_001204 [Chrysophaeum taylorii]|uniref:Apoptosis-antagonizing transcription factor C-terminal domain-containing protein n=1 Tax=Chrysophaeum taylorii TaxID=2483200 RepID=A0AAD7UCT3_9STRA|nr:hypothetical protein CTAYLR_001204 [Chrysophaeum taylorii]
MDDLINDLLKPDTNEDRCFAPEIVKSSGALDDRLVDDEEEEEEEEEEDGDDFESSPSGSTFLDGGESSAKLEALMARLDEEDAKTKTDAPLKRSSSEAARQQRGLLGDAMEARALMEPMMRAKGGGSGAVAAVRRLLDALIDLRTATQDDKPLEKRRCLDQQWSEIDRAHSRRREGWEAAMDAWRRRTHLGAAAARHSLKAVSLGPFEAAKMAMADRDRALKKMHPATSGGLDADTYDDGPFYRTLLRDLGDLRPSSDLAKHPDPKRNHRRDERDARASKGRKTRYETHEKLQNFMLPVPRRMSVVDPDILIRSLFGGANSTTTTTTTTTGVVSPDADDGPALFYDD